MRQFFQFVFALGLLALICWATWQGYLLLRAQQSGIPEHLRSLVVILVIVALIVAYLLTTAIQYHGDQNRLAHQGEARLVLYEKFLSAWELTARSIPSPDEGVLQLNIREFEGQLVLVASAKVVRAYNDLQQAIRETGLGTVAASASFKKLIVAMREDLGNNSDFTIRREVDRLRSLQSS